MEMSRLTQDGTAEPVSRDQTLKRKRGQGNINFPCSADHEKDWHPYPVDPYSCYMCDHAYMNAECLQIRIPDKRDMDPVPYEQVNKSELFPEIETAVKA